MKYVVDTHALLWFLVGSARLGTNAKAVLEDPSSQLILPATALAEACWIVERGRIPTITSPALVIAALDADDRFIIAPLDQAVIKKSNTLTTIGEMHDRQIAATATLLIERGESVALLTCDINITASKVVPIVW
nr:PIN domain-containing protein [Armatimonas sp.]